MGDEWRIFNEVILPAGCLKRVADESDKISLVHCALKGKSRFRGLGLGTRRKVDDDAFPRIYI